MEVSAQNIILSHLKEKAVNFKYHAIDCKRLGKSLKQIESSSDILVKAFREGLDPNYKKGRSLLDFSIMANDIECVQTILSHGGNVDALSFELCPTLEMFDLVAALKGTSIKDKNGRTPLHHAVISPYCLASLHENIDCATWLIDRLHERGVYESSFDNFGLAPIDYACLNKNKIAFDKLRLAEKKLASDLDIRDENGKTALIRAVDAEDKDLASQLIRAGANLNLRDYHQQTALSLALAGHHGKVVDQLLAAGAETNLKLKVSNTNQVLSALKKGFLGNAVSAVNGGITPPELIDILKTLHPRAIVALGYKPSDLDAFYFKKNIGKFMPKVVNEVLTRLLPGIENIYIPESKSKFKELMSDLNRTKEIYKEMQESGLYSDFIESNQITLDDLAAAGPCWMPETITVPVAIADRRGSMYSGPFYASQSHPWPLDARGEPAEPILQIDLSRVSRLSKEHESFGDGLLQIFVNDWDSSVSRVIPRSDTLESMLDPPVFSEDFSHAPSDWLGMNGKVTQIICCAGPYFSNCGMDLDIDGYATTPLVKKIHKLIAKISDHNASGFHLFGSYNPVQYNPGMELPTFFALDDGHGYVWGDAGNAQVRYNAKESKDGREEYEYSLMWSCY